MKERLKEFMDENELNAKELALKIDVQPSSVSHILTGRNKPSIEFLEKLLNVFPEIDLKYLISGEKDEVMDYSDTHSAAQNYDQKMSEGEKVTKSRSSERVLIFHSDGTYSEYLPR